MAVTLTGDQIERVARELQHIPGGFERAMSRAMNRAIMGARAAAIKGIRARYNVKAGEVRAAMPPIRKATPANLSAEFKAEGSKVNLYAFGPRPSKSGTGGKGRPQLTVSVLKGRRTKMRGAWVGTFRGRLRVAMRKGPKRFPIRSLSGPAVAQMMGVPDVIGRVEKVATERLDARIDHEIRVALERLDRRAR